MGMVQPFRILPLMGPDRYKTYGFARPLKTHWQQASCEDIDCQFFLEGWVTVVDESSDLGQKQAYYIRHDRSRRYSESRNEAGLICFTFPPGQRCFGSGSHRQPREILPRFYVKNGDWRIKEPPSRFHSTPEQWVEDLSEHQDRLATLIERG